MRLISLAKPIFSNHDSTSVWNPLTEPMRARGLQNVRFAVWLAGATQIKVQPGFEFSNDGVDWTGTVYGKAIQDAGKDWTNADGWTYGDFSTWYAVDNAGSQRQFVRFGILALNTTTSLPMQYALARVQVECQPVYGSSIPCPPTRVWTLNDNDFIPLTGPVLASDVANVRAELEISGLVAGTPIDVQAGWQQVNDPGVDTNWGAPNVFGTVRSTNGFHPELTYTAAAPTKQYVRFGVKVSKAAATDIRSCIVRARFDWR